MNTSPDSLQTTSRKFFGYAVGHDPTELYDAIERPRPDLLASSVSDYLIEQDQLKTEPILNKHTTLAIRPLFYAAINDVRTILTNQIYEHHLDVESLPILARDERTIRTIAIIAMNRDGIMRHMISPSARGMYYDLSQDESHLVPTEKLQPMPSGGCPFAANAERIPTAAPIFKRTIGFAADLTALAFKNTYLQK